MIDLPVEPLRHGLALRLHPFQSQGVEYLAEHERVLLADQMGTGKTVQTIAAIWETNSFPAVIVCPASLTGNWARELEACLPGIDVRVIAPGKEPDFTHQASVTVVGYEMLSRHVMKLRHAEAVVFDESHYLKSDGANRSRSGFKLVEGVRYRWLLSGTPVISRPSELIAQLEMLGVLGEFGGWEGYTERYCDRRPIPCPACRGKGFLWTAPPPPSGPRPSRRCGSCRGSMTVMDWSGSSNLRELAERLRERRYLRRLKREVLRDLPPKLPPRVIEVDLTNLAEYQDAERNIVAYLERKGDKAAAKRARKAKTITRMTMTRQLAAVGRAMPVIEHAHDFLDAERGKLLLFAHHRELQALLADALVSFGCVRLEGGNQRAAQRAVERFATDDSVKVMVASVGAGGIGHSMVATQTPVICEPPLTPKDLDQAEDRAHRIGQTLPVEPWHVIARGTIDERVLDLLAEKRAVIRRLEADGDDIAAQILANKEVEL